MGDDSASERVPNLELETTINFEMHCKKEEEKRENNGVDETTCYAKAKATTFFEHAPSLSLFLYTYIYICIIMVYI